MKLSFRTKLFLPLVISMVCLLGVMTVNVLNSRALRLEERKTQLIKVTDVVHSIAKEYKDLAASGALTEEEAKKQALDRIRALRYDNGTGYFSVVNSNLIAVMHPIKPELNGKDMSGMKDPKGANPFANGVNAAKATGAGFTEYLWAKPGQQEPVPKLAYNFLFKPWDWTVITGMYVDDLDAAFIKDLWASVFLLLGSSALLACLVVAIIRNIEASIGGDPDYANALAGTIAVGDLSSAIDLRGGDKGSVVLSMKNMQDQLASTISAVQESANTIAAASLQIAQGNNDLSARTESQASSIEETAATMEELTSTVKQNAENARHANTLAVSASDIAVRGGAVVVQVVDTMGSITESSKKIVDIISVIDSIAFQTNILALNAAVEAARAGEQGRGFAVVASEVRNLAQRSASAAKEIKTLIDDSVGKVNEGSRLVGEAGTTMNEIVDSVRKVTDIMAEIQTAGMEQASGIDQLNQAMVQMDQMTQQNAALVEEAAAAAESLQDQAGKMAQVVSVFKLRDGGHSLAPASASEQVRPMRIAQRSAFAGKPALRQIR